ARATPGRPPTRSPGAVTRPAGHQGGDTRAGFGRTRDRPHLDGRVNPPRDRAPLPTLPGPTMKTALLCVYFAGWALIPHLLLLKKRPAATLAWLWAIVFIPLFGAGAYLLFGTDRLKRRRLKRRELFSARAGLPRAPAS